MKIYTNRLFTHSLLKGCFIFLGRIREPTLRCPIFLRRHSLLPIGDRHILLMNSFKITAAPYFICAPSLYVLFLYWLLIPLIRDLMNLFLDVLFLLIGETHIKRCMFIINREIVIHFPPGHFIKCHFIKELYSLYYGQIHISRRYVYFPYQIVVLFISLLDSCTIIKASTQFYAKVIKVVPYPDKTLFEIFNILC